MNADRRLKAPLLPPECRAMKRRGKFYCGILRDIAQCPLKDAGPLEVVFCPGLLVPASMMAHWPERSWYRSLDAPRG